MACEDHFAVPWVCSLGRIRSYLRRQRMVICITANCAADKLERFIASITEQFSKPVSCGN